MNWSVVREIGIEYPQSASASSAQRLEFPIFAAQATDGTYLIVDEPWAEKPIPFRLECRTIRVTEGGNIVYDSTAHGIDDGYGCLVNDGTLALLRRTKWELLLLSSQEEVTSRIDLTNFSKRLPTAMSCSPEGTFLILFVDRSHQLDIVEIDRRGQLIWYLPLGTDCLGVPTSVQRLPAGTLLVADGFHHAAFEIDRQGTIVWQFGRSGDPARSHSRLAGPSSAREVADGDRLISDTRNHRVLRVHRDGRSEEVHLEVSGLTDPTFADMTPDDHLLICDAGNGRILKLNKTGKLVWQFGHPRRSQRWLSYPRSVEVTGPDAYLIADTAHDRILQFVNGRYEEIHPPSNTPFFWPRCVRRLNSGNLLIADGRHGRILEMSQCGQVHRELWEVNGHEPRKLVDPHDVRLLPNGHLLITDSPQDAVFEVDWSGALYRVLGEDLHCVLKDPHSAQQVGDSVVICDTGHHRIVWVDSQGVPRHCIETIQAGSSGLRMSRPRYLEVIPDGTMVVVDTGHNRVLLTTTSGHLLDEIRHLPDSPFPWFYQPRWAALVNRNEVAVVDHFHHRVVHLRKHPTGVG